MNLTEYMSSADPIATSVGDSDTDRPWSVILKKKTSQKSAKICVHMTDSHMWSDTRTGGPMDCGKCGHPRTMKSRCGANCCSL